MVTQNLDTNLDIMNGERGTIVNIILLGNVDLRHDKSDVIHLSTPPEYILVKLDYTRLSTLLGLDPNVILIKPATKTCQIVLYDNQKCSHTVTHQQLPITTAYACTDY